MKSNQLFGSTITAILSVRHAVVCVC